jgi:hypothetical protein
MVADSDTRERFIVFSSPAVPRAGHVAVAGTKGVS